MPNKGTNNPWDELSLVEDARHGAFFLFCFVFLSEIVTGKANGTIFGGQWQDANCDRQKVGLFSCYNPAASYS